MNRLLPAIISVALIVTLASCASTAAGGPGRSPSTCGTHVVVDESASGSTVCVALGSELIVMLHFDTGEAWSDPQVQGGSLGPGTGIPTPNNAVGWSFKALGSGTSEIAASRPNCPAASPGTAGCHSRMAFQLEVDVP